MNNKNEHLVSIIIPTYNHASYLGRALQSVINQTYTDWEAIVIDNHSTDKTDQVMLKFKDPRIKYLKINNDGIIAKSRNKGIKVAKGKWVAFLDSDDWWTSDKLKMCLSFANENVDLIYHDLKIEYDNKKFFRRKKIKTRKLKKPILIDLLVAGNAIGNSSVVLRKKILERIGGIDESKELVAAEDYNAWLKISQLTDQFCYLPMKLGYYLIHSQSISKKNMSLPVRNVVRKFMSELNRKQKIKLEANLRYLSGRFYYLNHNFEKSKKDLFFTLCHGFIHLRFRALLMIFIMILR